MKKLFVFTIVLIFNLSFSQQIFVRYIHVLSPYTTSYEDLYIKNNQVISIQDSIININNNSSAWMISAQLNSSRKTTKEYIISDLIDGERNFFFTSNIDTKDYFIYDKVPNINWVVDESKTKKTANYTCYKATANFRGSNITAYFSKDLPYSTGPFKFYGLPGLILEVKVDNLNYDIWKAESISIDDSHDIIFKPKFLNKEKVSFKDFITSKEEYLDKKFSDLKEKISSSAGSEFGNLKMRTSKRFGIEQVFEWEMK